MKNAKLTDKTDNYRILSVYIDNIMRKLRTMSSRQGLFLIVILLS